MEKEYLDRKANSSTAKCLFGSGRFGKNDKNLHQIISISETLVEIANLKKGGIL